MKTLKLEVGKTYLNREGKRVKIVEETGSEIFPFGGDDYQSYTLDGHWMHGGDSDLDLIAEAPAPQPEKRTFKIPENTREISVSETDGRIIIEFVPEVPELTERERIINDGMAPYIATQIVKRLIPAGRTDSETLAEIIEQYIKEREAQQCK